MTHPPHDAPWFPLRTERLLLRPFVAGDLAAVHAYANDPEVSRFMGWGPNDHAATQAFLDGLLKDQEAWPRPTVQLALERLDAPGVIGTVGWALIHAGRAWPTSATCCTAISGARAMWSRRWRR